MSKHNKSMKNIFYSIRLLFITLGFLVGSVTHAETLKIMGLVIGKSTPEEVLTTIKRISPAAKIDEKINEQSLINIDKIQFEGRTYTLKVVFENNSEKKLLSELHFSSTFNPYKTSPLLQGFKSEKNNNEYIKFNIKATRKIVEKQENLIFSAIPEETFLSRIFTTVIVILIGIAALLAFVSIRYFYWWLAGAALGYIFGDIVWGLVFGVIVAIINLLISKPTNSGSYTSASYENGFQETIQINPANGLPMNGGVDVYGNTAGSDSLGLH